MVPTAIKQQDHAMSKITTPSAAAKGSAMSRRTFISGSSTAAIGLAIAPAVLTARADDTPKIRLGLMGCGGRGQFIANLFENHGGYKWVAVSDYFEDRVNSVGEKFKIDPRNRFTGLSGYRRMLDQDLDAVVIQTPPYFHPDQVEASVQAGKHIYLAKPLAVDVPGCHSIAENGRRATAKKLCFLVDFQTRAHPSYQEVVRRVQQGMIGRIVSVESNYQTSTMFANLDNQMRARPDDRELKLRAWALDRALSGDVITEQNIHTLDVVSWFLDSEPLRAYGTGGRARNFVGNCWDHYALIFYYPKDVIVSFCSKQVGFGFDDIMCRVYGEKGTADTHYFGKVNVRSNEDAFNGGEMTNLYTDGTVLNIDTFHASITQADYSNPTVAASVRSNLVTILGRTAAYQNREVTWEEVIKSKEKLEADLRGLKV
jgi:myo-inositol 2-dehydrogenase / D-chiro-inositol 1-dehydrogenase